MVSFVAMMTTVMMLLMMITVVVLLLSNVYMRPLFLSSEVPMPTPAPVPAIDVVSPAVIDHSADAGMSRGH